MEALIQIAGWIGTFLIVFAYYLISYKKVEGNSKVYQVMNLTGAICMGVNVFYQHAWPAVALQVVWGVIAVLALTKKQSAVL